MATAAETHSGGGTASAVATASAGVTQKVDLENVDISTLPEELQALAKSLQGDYTRKTQALADQRKEAEEKARKADETLDWYSKNEAGINEFNEWKEKQAEEKVEDIYDGAENLDDIKKMQLEYDKKLKSVQDQYAGAMQQGYTQIKELVDIKIADPDADWDKILATARENGITDMRKAYNLTYEETLTKKRIDEAVAAKEKELKEKHEAQVLTAVTPLGRESRKVIKPAARRR